MIVDITGQELSVGDRIACAFAVANRAELRLGRIAAFVLHKTEYGTPDGMQMIEVEWEKVLDLFTPKTSRIRADVIKFAKIPEEAA